MFLKSLILRGFKTFADKTVFEFEPHGLTAIVGPNGCGKSNMVDSFRFILGEGSPTELRIKALPEVIFAGTKLRKPLSLAEVALVLDNTDHSLPLDFSEVAIRRRTFRDGNGEFQINNSPCRLKDIRDLFADASISEDSLAIIGQGKVDAILSSQPEERRAVFEEVAGIRKYKQRKQEAEKKLILAEQNILRISDLKNEIGENLSVLEAQARAAEKYTRLKESLKNLDLGITKKQTITLLEKTELLRNEIENFQKGAEEQNKKEKIIGAEKQALKEKAKTLEAELEACFEQLEAKREEIENERGRFIVEQQRILFEEKNKLRDVQEAERFLVFEIDQLSSGRASLEAKLEELKMKSGSVPAEELNILPELKDLLSDSEKLLIISKKLIHLLHRPDPTCLPAGRVGDDTKTRELALLREKIETLSKRVSGFEEENQDPLKNSRNTLVFRKLEEAHAHLLEKVSSIKKDKEKISNQLDLLESAHEKPENAIEREELFKGKLLLAKTEGELSQIRERFETEYGLSLEQLINCESKVQNIAAAKKEAQQIRSAMLELEPVNLLAIEEFKSAEERYQLINQQYQDLISAKTNLTGLINELDNKAKEEFLIKMGIISKHFEQVFSELFPGGEARLELDLGEKNDPLSAGIDIRTCPSGRKWLPLQALSGGERALTAIAILFAFLKTNPSPFCILDEVDAPLDDANIDRFTRYLKAISSRTQILIITHNKHTMKAADTLYGITMQEAGVSRVVSMKMNKVAPAR